MMQPRDMNIDLAALADGTLAGPEWDAWLAANPDLATEVEIARRVRALVGELRGVMIEVPPDFEVRLLERVRQDTALTDLLDLGLAGLGQTIVELLELLLSFLPGPQPAPAI